jgi:hypothetical protein
VSYKELFNSLETKMTHFMLLLHMVKAKLMHTKLGRSVQATLIKELLHRMVLFTFLVGNTKFKYCEDDI